MAALLNIIAILWLSEAALTLRLGHLEKLSPLKLAQGQSIYLTQQEASLLEQQFKKYDEDGDGRINYLQMRNVLYSVGDTYCPIMMKTMFDRADDDQDGTITFSQFLETLAKAKKYIATKSFQNDDLNKDGFVSAWQLKQVERVGGKRVQLGTAKSQIARFDTDGDQLLDFRQFVSMMR